MTRLFERMQAGGGDAGLAAVTALMEEYHRDGKVDDVAMALWRRADEQQGADDEDFDALGLPARSLAGCLLGTTRQLVCACVRACVVFVNLCSLLHY